MAGIGGGNYAAGGNITINGGIITATGAYHAAGIGGGFATVNASTPDKSVTPAVVDQGKGIGKSGNITINGGLSYSNGGAHANAFGDGCHLASYQSTSETYDIIITGGTVIPTAGSSNLADFGGKQSTVYVLGGSFKAKNFESKEGKVAYGDMDKKTKVFMTEISLRSFGIDKVGTTLVDDIDMKINGVNYNYGVPSYTDSEGNLYFWLPDTNKGSEVSVDLDVLDKQTGEAIKTDTFFAKDVGTGSNTHLKQYVKFNVDRKLDDSLIKKRYDGVGLNDSEIKAQIAAMEIETTLPEGGKLTNASKMEISSQLLEDDGETVADDAEIVQGSNPNAGKYQLIITSTEYADLTTDGFNDAYWGHRAYYKYAEITPADTQTKLGISGVEVKDGKFSPSEEITLSANVRPKDGEGINCASPKGYVQFYINGQKYGDPVELTAHDKDASSNNYNYSTAQLKWKPVDTNVCKPGDVQEIKVVYIGEDPNYTTSEDRGNIKLYLVNVDTDEDGTPDINIDTDGDEDPDINIDTDNDWKEDVNIDTDKDNNPDVNVDIDGDKKPDINVDTDNGGTWKPSTEGGNEDGIWKPDTDLDTNGDGNIDKDHIYRPGYDKDKDGVDDSWNPDKDVDLDGDDDPEYDTSNPGINIDTDGDGNPDINIDIDGDGKPDINIDTDKDGLPDVNVDTDEDGIPDINVDTDNTGEWNPSGEGGNKDDIWKPDTDLDINGDGKVDIDHSYRPGYDNDKDGVDDNWKPDKDVDLDGDKIPDYDTSHPNINVDTDGDGNPDINIDTDNDGDPDINIDTDGDGDPDINIDTNGDGKPDKNIDKDGDGKVDPETGSSNDSEKDSSSVDTSDNNNVNMYIFIALLSIVALSGTCLILRNKFDN